MPVWGLVTHAQAYARRMTEHLIRQRLREWFFIEVAGSGWHRVAAAAIGDGRAPRVGRRALDPGSDRLVVIHVGAEHRLIDAVSAPVELRRIEIRADGSAAPEADDDGPDTLSRADVAAIREVVDRLVAASWKRTNLRPIRTPAPVWDPAWARAGN